MRLIWPKAEGSLLPAPADVNPLAWIWSWWCLLLLLVFQLPRKDPWIPALAKTQRTSAESSCALKENKTILHQDSWEIYSLFERLVYDWVWRMLCSTAQILNHYRSCYFLVLRRPPFPSSYYSSYILPSWHERQLPMRDNNLQKKEFILPASYTITLQRVWWAQANITDSIL